FQPFHTNHYNAYKFLKNKFKNNVFIATSNKVEEKSPFNFKDKQLIINKMFGIPTNNILLTNNPYRPTEISSKYKPEETILIYGIGEKDGQRLASSKYFKKYTDTSLLETYDKAAYYIIIPHQSLTFDSKLIDGTLVRTIFSGKDEDKKLKLFNILYKKFNKTIFDLFKNKIKLHENIIKYINETSITNGYMVDDGPSTWIDNFDYWKSYSDKLVNKLGGTILNYLTDNNINKLPFNDYPSGPVTTTSFGKTGIGKSTPNNQINLEKDLANKRWRNHINRIVNLLGWDYIKWDNKDKHITESLILEGGAAGHMQHPFDNMDLTFSDIKNMIELGLQGKLENVSEKIDGQNMFISVTDRGVVAARNKSNLKNFGKEALDIKSMKSMFSGRGDIEAAFVGALIDLNLKLNNKKILNLLQNGKYWINLEIIYPATTNVIPYGLNMLLFHNIIEVDEAGNKVGIVKDYDILLKDIITSVNANIQTKFNLKLTGNVTLNKSADYSKKRAYFIDKLNKLRNKFKLSWNDKIIKYHYCIWDDIISKAENIYKYYLNSKAKNALLNRWVYGDKSVSLTQFKSLVENEEMLNWIKEYDKVNYVKQLKENLEPFELLILEWGVELLKNVKDYLAVNPTDSYNKMRADIDKTMQDLKTSTDVIDVNKINTLINKINLLGGFENVVPIEGITFMYKGQLYKATGVFAPLNQLLGYLKFKR
nr:hypothetical protein [Thermotogota bacterium]